MYYSILVAVAWFFIVCVGFLFLSRKKRKVFYLYFTAVLLVPLLLIQLDSSLQSGYNGFIFFQLFFLPAFFIGIIFSITYEYKKQKEKRQMLSEDNDLQKMSLSTVKKQLRAIYFYRTYLLFELGILILFLVIYGTDQYTIGYMVLPIIFLFASFFVSNRIRKQSINSHIIFVLFTLVFAFYFASSIYPLLSFIFKLTQA